MNRKWLLVISLIILFSLAFVGLFLWRGWKKSQEYAFVSCLASIMRSLNDEELNKLRNVSLKFKDTNDWTILDEGETGEILNTVQVFDCKGMPATKLIDPWDNKVLIAYKHNTPGTMFLVWTSGRDKISGTEDDLVYPVGTKTIPK